MEQNGMEVGSVGGSSIVSHPPEQAGPASAVAQRSRGCVQPHGWLLRAGQRACTQPQACPSCGAPTRQTSAGLSSSSIQQRTQLRFAVCSRLRACQMISDWLAANCLLPGCDVPVCDSLPSRYFSALTFFGCHSPSRASPCAVQGRSYTLRVIISVWVQSAFPLPCPYKEDCIMKLCAMRWIWFKMPVPVPWGIGEQEWCEKSYLNHEYIRKGKKSAAPV